jgi:hypothetical protein
MAKSAAQLKAERQQMLKDVLNRPLPSQQLAQEQQRQLHPAIPKIIALLGNDVELCEATLHWVKEKKALLEQQLALTKLTVLMGPEWIQNKLAEQEQQKERQKNATSQ